MSTNKKKQPMLCVTKLFKTINQSGFVNIKPCFCAMQNVFISRGYSMTDVEVNYGEKKWKDVDSFYRFLEAHDVVSFYASFAPKGGVSDMNFAGIDYSNHLLNLENITDEKDYVDFCLVFPCEWYGLDLIKTLVKTIDDEIALTYAYVCFLPADYDINSERAVKKSLFTMSSSVTQDDIDLRNNMRSLDCGFIPKQYPVNFYNSKQLEDMAGSFDIEEKISDGLTLITFAL